jgi:plastocyanin
MRARRGRRAALVGDLAPIARAWVLAVVVGLFVVAPAVEAKPAVKCHWVKATKKRKRHRVCVKVKGTKKKATSAPVLAAPVAPSAPAAPTAPATPAAVTPAPVDPATPAVPAPSDPGPVALTRLQTTAREWSLTLSRPTIAAGAVSLQLVNAGEDAHDLHVRPAAGGADVLAASSVEPGRNTTISGTLPAGTYTLYCSLPSHEGLGMRATLTVTG